MSMGEILKELKALNGHQGLYDYIACNYYKMTDEQLKDILLEVIANISYDQYQKCVDNLPKWLVEYKGWEDNEND